MRRLKLDILNIDVKNISWAKKIFLLSIGFQALKLI